MTMYSATISRFLRWSLPLAFSVICILPTTAARAQSLDSHHPAPLQPGDNNGTVDNFVGSNYFYLTGGPGSVTITVSYKSMGLLGNAQRSSLNVELTDDKHSWSEKRTISSVQQSNSTKMVGNLKVPTRLILSIMPPSGGLVRMGGDYVVSAAGAVKFDPPLSPAEQIVGTYTPMVIQNNEDSAAKFEPNGILEFASGTMGRWKLFDAGSMTFTVTYGSVRQSLKLIPGRGLVDPHDPTVIVLQRTH
jgi:hypothetical protein